jgi:hypothetical protein
MLHFEFDDCSEWSAKSRYVDRDSVGDGQCFYRIWVEKDGLFSLEPSCKALVDALQDTDYPLKVPDRDRRSGFSFMKFDTFDRATTYCIEAERHIL